MQIHKRFTTEQVRALLKEYCQGTLDGPSIEEILEIGKSRFFILLREYHRDPMNSLLVIGELPQPGYLLLPKSKLRVS